MDLLSPFPVGWLGAVVVAAVGAGMAYAFRQLTRAGALAAAVVGVWMALAGVVWCAATLLFFVSSAAFGSLSRRSAGGRAAAKVAAVGKRDAWQVWANGAVVTLCAAGALYAPHRLWLIAGLGALAAATADTWATELGTAFGGEPRAVGKMSRVPPGTSGAVSILGTCALVAGALGQGTLAWAAGVSLQAAAAVAIGGVTGALVDTVAGATIQERRWCSTCSHPTEQIVHHCGHRTFRTGGLTGMTNDAVNVMCTVCGALGAIAFA